MVVSRDEKDLGGSDVEDVAGSGHNLEGGVATKPGRRPKHIVEDTVVRQDDGMLGSSRIGRC